MSILNEPPWYGESSGPAISVPVVNMCEVFSWLEQARAHERVMFV